MLCDSQVVEEHFVSVALYGMWHGPAGPRYTVGTATT